MSLTSSYRGTGGEHGYDYSARKHDLFMNYLERESDEEDEDEKRSFPDLLDGYKRHALSSSEEADVTPSIPSSAMRGSADSDTTERGREGESAPNIPVFPLPLPPPLRSSDFSSPLSFPFIFLHILFRLGLLVLLMVLKIQWAMVIAMTRTKMRKRRRRI
jgi:hypothetical protein